MKAERSSAMAPAKINLVLEVLAKRADGYHEIDTILQTVALSDTVTVDLDTEPGVTVVGPFAAGAPGDATNLAWRAASALAISTGRSIDRLHITIDKQVPAAGGLGGGSSDAATTLRLLQQPWRADDARLLAAAASVGSDEAFFLYGGTARARGRGEFVTPLPPLAGHGVVLFIPPATIERKTARLFSAIDALPFDRGGIAHAFEGRGQRPVASVASIDVFNAFERVAFDVFPWLSTLWESLESRVGEPVHLCGAGPTMFWIGPSDRAAGVAAAAADAACTTIATHTVGPSWP